MPFGVLFGSFLVSFLLLLAPLGSLWLTCGGPWPPWGDLGTPLDSSGLPLGGPWGFHGTPLASLGCLFLGSACFLHVFCSLACSWLASGCFLFAFAWFLVFLTALLCYCPEKRRKEKSRKEKIRLLRKFPKLKRASRSIAKTGF